jgi:DNA primase
MACPKAEEVIDHKKCLYAMDLATTDTVVIVEGTVDQWKLGPSAVATFGQSFTLEQVKLLVNRWKRRIVLYDKGAVQADKLANMLSGFSGETELACLNDLKDPGELTPEKGKEIMEKLGAL